LAKHHSEEFFSFDLDTLRAGEPVTFEVYLYLPLNEHVIRLIAPPDVIEGTFIERFKKKGIRQLHIRNQDHAKYVEYLKAKTIAPTPAAPSAPPASITPVPPPPSPKAPEVVPDPVAVDKSTEPSPSNTPPPEELPPPTLDDVIPFIPDIPPEVIFKDLLVGTPEDAAKATEHAGHMVKKILEDSNTSAAEAVANASYEHANSVAVYSVLFAMGIGVKDKSLLQDFVTASLAHDVGLSQCPPSVCKVPVLQHAGAQKNQYETHVARALQLVDELGFVVSSRARKIIEQHHEKFDGSGYPAHLEGFHISDHAQILGLAELIDSMNRGFYDGKKYTLNDSIALVCKIEKQTTFPVYFNPDIFKKVMLWIRKGSGLDFMAQAASVVDETRAQILDSKPAA